MIAAGLAQLIPLAFASGLNVYATIAVLGLCEHYHLVDLPEQFRAFDHPAIIGIALVMYLVEFVADKIPWFDSVWDAVHTVVRPVGGALVAVNAMGNASPFATALAALLGGSIAMTTHVTKAGTRAAVNTSPEPFSNWVLSLSEDAIAIGLSYLALKHPYAAAAIAIALLAAFITAASFIVAWVRRRVARRQRVNAA
ncbi:MAG TPA: DUF4126 domain-containing protein [Vicinamibacterales bacterium]|nr:DUF4126 domain-containing protein [Vicinamibacterales bacterium]